MGWRVLLGRPRHPPGPAAPASSVFLVGQLGKYLPARSGPSSRRPRWAPGSRCRDGGWRSSASSRSGWPCSPACLLGIPAVPRLLASRSERRSRGGGSCSPSSLGCVLLWPRLLNAVIARGLRLLRREPLEHELSGRAVALTSAWFVAAWVSTGLGTFVLARSVAPGRAARAAARDLHRRVRAGVGRRDVQHPRAGRGRGARRRAGAAARAR